MSLSLALAACTNGEGDAGIHRVDDPSLDAFETILAQSDVIAGTSVAVECVAIYSDGKREPMVGPQVTIDLAPAEGIAVEGPNVVATEAGTFTITCRLQGFGGTTKSAELLVIPADAAQIVATVDRSETKAGEPVTVTCKLEDEHGNQADAPDATVRASPSRGATVDGRQLTLETVGEYDVECRLGQLPRVTATVSVVPNDPTNVVVEATPRSAAAGERIDITCHLVDAYTNPVMIAAVVDVTPVPDTLDATGFVANTAGDYGVTCALPDFGLVSDVLTVAIRPAVPATIRIVALDPMNGIYASGDVVTPELVVADIFGNIIENPFVTFSGLPTGAVTDLGDRAVFLGDGPIALVATVDPPTYQDQVVQDTFMVIVDGLPPQVNITFPSRGEMVQRDPDLPLTIRGTVTDQVSPVTDFLIGGQPISFDANGAFTATMNPGWGINTIAATAVDGAGNVRELAQSFEIASAYRRASPSRTFSGRIHDGVIAHLGQAALDDNNSDVDDLATIARLAIQNMNVAALIPSPVTTFNSDCSIPFVTIRGALRLYVDGVTFGTPTIDINSRNGGLFARISVPTVRVNMRTRGDVCDIGVNLSGSATASRIVISGNLNISRNGGSSRVTMPSATVDIHNLRINLNLPSIIDWAVDGIINLFRGAIASRLESAFRDIIRAEIPAVVEDFLDAVDISTGFDLPAPLSTRLEVRSGLGMLQFDTIGGNIGLDTTVYATPAMSPEPRGGILQEQQTLPTFSSTRPLGVALGYDLLNQATYSAWYGGAFDIDLAQFFSGQLNNNGQMVNLTATADPLLPPVVRPSGSPTYPVEIQVGDLGLDLDITNVPNFPMIQARIYAAATIRANVTVNSQGILEFTIAPNPTFAFDIESSLDTLLDPVALRATLEAIVTGFVPYIVADVVAGIPLPTIDLSAIPGNFLPPGIVLGLGGAQTRFHPSYLILEGNLVSVP